MKSLVFDSEYDCYRTLALLRKIGESTTYEIADIVGREVPNTLQTLRYLEQKGLIVKTKPGVKGAYHKPASWKANPKNENGSKCESK